MKTALVTGSSRGIGAAAAKELARLGYAVAVNYKSHCEAAEAVCKEIRDFGGVAEAFQADISDTEALDRMFSEIKTDLGEVSVLVNNAGVSYIGLLQDMSDEEIKSLSDVNLLGAMLCTKRAVPDMIKRHDGVIINIASMWGEVGASCEVVYSACKAGIIGFTKALAKELGPSGIRVNCVSPGVIDTDMNSELTDKTISELCEETPLLRIGTPADVGKTIAFLASEEASFITGQVISVNGGII
ncbi:MAG: SDR family oxidoreductase [Oscillospiraceae bacterium]|nr:SDR family oxidoreductase [Ruminococcus sp.]MCD8346013.1 SDR family oxidoreductase [Oscillospiraceae bacterium]